MNFRYIGTGKQTEVFGYTFPQGQAVEVTDPYAVHKLSNHPLFEAVEIDEPEPVKKRGGRPPKVKK